MKMQLVMRFWHLKEVLTVWETAAWGEKDGDLGCSFLEAVLKALIWCCRLP